MKRTFLGCVLSVIVLTASPAAAVEWGVQATASITDIFPDNGQRNSRSVGAGGAGIPVADAMFDDSVPEDISDIGPFNRGNAHAFAGLQFAANTPPALKAEGFLTGQSSGVPHLGDLPNGAVVDASAFASDLFQYMGTTPTTLSINFTLEGIVSDDPVDLTDRTGISALVAVLADTPNYRFSPFLSSLVFEGGTTLLDSEQVEIKEDTAGAAVSRLATLSFSVNPGDTFYVWQKLNISAVRGTRFADAFNTLTSTFSAPESVQSLSAVPEPASLGLASLASLAVAVAEIGRKCRRSTV